MRRRTFLGTSVVAVTSLTGCVEQFHNGYILNNLLLSEPSATDNETDQDQSAGDAEIIVECDGEVVHTSTHARPIEQPSENEPIIVSDEFPDERYTISLTVNSGDNTFEREFYHSLFGDNDEYCIDIHVSFWGDRVSINLFDEPYNC